MDYMTQPLSLLLEKDNETRGQEDWSPYTVTLSGAAITASGGISFHS